MNIYQGEPITFTLTVKDDNGAYLPSLSNLSLEALINNTYDSNVVKKYSTAKGTISRGTYVQDQTTIGYASFGLTGEDTSNMNGDYTIELAKAISDGRAIGIANGVFTVEPAKIKGGIE